MSNQPAFNFEENADNQTHGQPLSTFLESAYRRYAILTILDRALPDARDGLKPVQRRILYAMGDMGLRHDLPHKKSARIVGEVLGKYHPHGDSAVYDAMVRMAQDFSMRYPLVDGQGNYGSMDGDSAAAMRYTEARLTHLGETVLTNLEEDTVDWRPNFDGSLNEPVVLPTRFPNLLLNGSAGIAVGMSTNILPHNLGEVCDAVMYVAQNWDKRKKIGVDDLMKFIPGPDLPTGGLLYRYRTEDGVRTDMIRQAYETGRATLVVQAKADIQDIGGGKSEIIITELPYQVQKNTILERVAASKEKFAGLTDARDESDYKGMRVVFEVARGADPREVLERLLTYTQMRSSLSYNAMALVRDENNVTSPNYITLKDFLTIFIQHRLEVITRRSKYQLERAEKRLHIVQGLLKALSAIDEVIAIIRHSRTVETAKANLMKKLDLSPEQAQAILDMPLRRLAALERKKLEDEEQELLAHIKELKTILGSEKKRLEVVVAETQEIKNSFADPRRTIIIDAEEGHEASVTVAELSAPTEAQVIVVDQDNLYREDAKGYRDNFQTGKPSIRAVSVPLLKTTLEPSETLLMVSSKGRLWHGGAGRLPQKVNFDTLGLEKDEQIVGIGAADPDLLLVMGTRHGLVKRVKIEDCINSSEGSWSQIIGLNGVNGHRDEVLFATVASDEAHILLCTAGDAKTPARMLRFPANAVNPQATPSARGVAGIKLLEDQLVCGAVIEPAQLKKGMVVIVSQRGYAKRVALDEFPVQGRGGQGVQCLKASPSAGGAAGFAVGAPKDHVDVFSTRNKRLRLGIDELPAAARAALGSDLGAKYAGGKLFAEDAVAGVVIL